MQSVGGEPVVGSGGGAPVVASSPESGPEVGSGGGGVVSPPLDSSATVEAAVADASSSCTDGDPKGPEPEGAGPAQATGARHASKETRDDESGVERASALRSWSSIAS